MTPDVGISEAGFRIFRYIPSYGLLCFWTIRGERTVFQIKSIIWRERCPRKMRMGVCVFCFPVSIAPCPQKGGLTFAYTIGAFFGCFRAFWKPPQLTTKPNVLLNTLPHILHQVCGLTIQHITNLLQGIHGQMLHRSHADGGHRRRADAGAFRKFLLGHSTQGKHYFDFELNHRFSPLSFWRYCTTLSVVNQYAKRKNISYFVKEITLCVLTNYDFRSIIFS